MEGSRLKSALPIGSTELPRGIKKRAGGSHRRVGSNDDADYLTLTSLISNCTATFGGNGVRGSAP